MDKRGQRKHFRAKKAVYLIVYIMILGTFIIWGIRHVINNWIISASETELTETRAAMYPVQELNEENAALREKLEFSSKIQTDDTTKELVRFYIHKHFPESEWATAEAISKCESGMNPKTINDKNTNGSVDRGAWQINSIHAKRFEQMYGIKWEIGAHDLSISTQYARFLYDHSGWNPWVCARIIK